MNLQERIMTPEQKQRALQILRRFEQANPMTRQADNAAVDMAALLHEITEQQEVRTPIKELMAQYAAEGCDFSDLRWLRETARRLATTMPDGQARCILFALAEQSASVPVLTVECEPGYWSGGHYHEGTKPYIAPAKVWELPIGTKLYTAPAAPEQQSTIPANVADAYAKYKAANVAALKEFGEQFPQGATIRISDVQAKSIEAFNKLVASMDAAIAAEKGGA